MTNIAKIDEEVNEISSLKSLTEVYGEIAAIRMRRVRDLVLKNRDFLAAIDSVFRDCLASYAQKLANLVKLGKLRKGQKVTFLGHNGKTVATLISANTRFYGEVLRSTFDKFIEDVRKHDYEVTIIGKVGRGMFIDAEPNRPYTYFELPDFGTDANAISQTIAHLVQYQEIRVYFAKYESVVRQKATDVAISAGTEVKDVVATPTRTFIFEPSLEKVLMFFETQIFASLFDQSIRESQLAKMASRILAMDKASGSINDRLKALRFEKIKLRHQREDKKLLSSIVPVIELTSGRVAAQY